MLPVRKHFAIKFLTRPVLRWLENLIEFNQWGYVQEPMTLIQRSDSSLFREIEEVKTILEANGFERVFFVCDQSAYVGSGADTALEPVLQGLSSIRFSEFELNPKIEDIQKGVDQFRSFNPDLVIALGGGSAIDVAKAIAFVGGFQDGSANDLILNQRDSNGSTVPILAIPTTAGTGSEATHFAVVYIENEKHSLASQCILSKYVVLDYRLTKSLPKHVTAASGLDALCQSIESLWSVGGTDESRSYAADALKLAWNSLEQVTNNPKDEFRKSISEASYLAGKAINISKTTGPHALSYKLTSDLGVPHGFAVGVFLAPFLLYNSKVTPNDCNDVRGSSYSKEQIDHILEVTQCQDENEFCQKFLRLLKQIGAPVFLSDIGISTAEEVEQFVGKANFQRLSNNPRKVLKEEFAKHLLEFNRRYGCILESQNN